MSDLNIYDHIFFDLSISSCHYSESVSQAVSDLLFSKYSVNQGIQVIQVIQVRHVIHLIHVIHEIHIIQIIRVLHSMQVLQVNQVIQIIKVIQVIQFMRVIQLKGTHGKLGYNTSNKLCGKSVASKLN